MLKGVNSDQLADYRRNNLGFICAIARALVKNPKLLLCDEPTGAADDQQINVQCGYFFGVLLMMLFAYVISVFVVHGIERESSVIGALYALGVKRRDLMLHYLTLPVCVTTVAGLIGFGIGISPWGIPTQMADAYAYYSVPQIEVLIPPILIIYGIIMPPVTAIIVNYFVIRKKLSKTALSLIKNEVKQPKGSNVNLGSMGFISRFRIRQMLREMRTGITVIIGMFISLICLMLSLNTAVLCSNVQIDNVKDTKYEYMYTYKYPTENPPEGGEAAYVKTLKKEILGYNWDINVLGLEEDSKYFDAKVVKGSKKKVAVDSARLYSIVTKSDIEASAGIFSDLMRSMVIMIAVSAAICLPLSKAIMDQAYPFMVSNVNCGINIAFKPWLWAVLYAAILLLYFVINKALVGRLNKIVPAEVLKNRE